MILFPETKKAQISRFTQIMNPAYVSLSLGKVNVHMHCIQKLHRQI